MQPSEIFKDMDEAKAYAERMRPYLPADEFELFLYLLGLLENRAISETVRLQEQEVKIDRYLVPMVLDLNERGINTLASCSGLREEHPEEKFRPKSGYLAIAYDKELEQFLISSLDDPTITVMNSECYLKPSVQIYVSGHNDTELKAKWDIIWSVLRAWNPK